MVTANILRYGIRLGTGLMLFVASASALTFKNETGYPVNISWCYDHSLFNVTNRDLTECVVNPNAEFEVPGSTLKSYYPIIKSVEFEVKINGQYKVYFAFDAKELTRFSYFLKLEKRNSTVFDMFENEADKAKHEWNLLLYTTEDGKTSGLFQIVRVQKIN